MFSAENIFVFGGKSPERVPPDVFCNIPCVCSLIPDFYNPGQHTFMPFLFLLTLYLLLIDKSLSFAISYKEHPALASAITSFLVSSKSLHIQLTLPVTCRYLPVSEASHTQIQPLRTPSPETPSIHRSPQTVCKISALPES